eukprot:scaffold28967_cov66-Phaeocystis_antarctica.AAC.1
MTKGPIKPRDTSWLHVSTNSSRRSAALPGGSRSYPIVVADHQESSSRRIERTLFVSSSSFDRRSIGVLLATGKSQPLRPATIVAASRTQIAKALQQVPARASAWPIVPSIESGTQRFRCENKDEHFGRQLQDVRAPAVVRCVRRRVAKMHGRRRTVRGDVGSRHCPRPGAPLAPALLSHDFRVPVHAASAGWASNRSRFQWVVVLDLALHSLWCHCRWFSRVAGGGCGCGCRGSRAPVEIPNNPGRDARDARGHCELARGGGHGAKQTADSKPTERPLSTSGEHDGMRPFRGVRFLCTRELFGASDMSARRILSVLVLVNSVVPARDRGAHFRTDTF